MLDAAKHYPWLASRIAAYSKCKNRFRELLTLVDPASVPTSHKPFYASLMGD